MNSLQSPTRNLARPRGFSIPNIASDPYALGNRPNLTIEVDANENEDGDGNYGVDAAQSPQEDSGESFEDHYDKFRIGSLNEPMIPIRQDPERESHDYDDGADVDIADGGSMDFGRVRYGSLNEPPGHPMFEPMTRPLSMLAEEPDSEGSGSSDGVEMDSGMGAAADVSSPDHASHVPMDLDGTPEVNSSSDGDGGGGGDSDGVGDEIQSDTRHHPSVEVDVDSNSSETELIIDSCAEDLINAAIRSSEADDDVASGDIGDDISNLVEAMIVSACATPIGLACDGDGDAHTEPCQVPAEVSVSKDTGVVDASTQDVVEEHDGIRDNDDGDLDTLSDM